MTMNVRGSGKAKRRGKKRKEKIYQSYMLGIVISLFPFSPSSSRSVSNSSVKYMCFVFSWYCLVLSCLIWPCLALSFLAMSCLILSYLVLPCLALPCLVLSCLVLSCFVLSWSCRVLSCLILFKLFLYVPRTLLCSST